MDFSPLSTHCTQTELPPVATQQADWLTRLSDNKEVKTGFFAPASELRNEEKWSGAYVFSGTKYDLDCIRFKFRVKKFRLENVEHNVIQSRPQIVALSFNIFLPIAWSVLKTTACSTTEKCCCSHLGKQKIPKPCVSSSSSSSLSS